MNSDKRTMYDRKNWYVQRNNTHTLRLPSPPVAHPISVHQLLPVVFAIIAENYKIEGIALELLRNCEEVASQLLGER